MFFNSVDEVESIAKKTGCAVFVVPDSEKIMVDNALELRPEEKTVITVEQVRDVIGSVMIRQTDDRFIIIRPADKLSDVAANAFLKSLEEPNEKVHYILITNSPSKLPVTILSRSAIYFLRKQIDFKTVDGDEKEKALAKRLMTAKDSELVGLAEEIGSNKKGGVREYALRVVGLAIEMLYKSYFMTNRDVFLKKLPKFLDLYENIERNGHIKLHLVSDLC